MTATVSHSARPLPDRRFGQAIVLFAVCFALLLTLGLVAQAISLAAGLAFTLVVLVLLPAVLFVRLKGIRVLAGLRLEPVAPSLVFGSLLVGVGGWSLAIYLHQLVTRVIGSPPDLGLGTETLAAYLTMLAAGALLPGLCEECLFRGAIQGVLERRGPWVAVLVAGGLFGLFHLDPWRILPAALLGCIFGWLTVRTRSLIPAIVAHAANNVTAITVGHFLGTPPGWLLLVLAITFVVFVTVVAARTEPPARPAVHPLATVPAGLPRPVAWAGGIAAILVAATAIAVGLLVVSLVTTVEMSDDALSPQIEAGDTLVLVRSSSFAFDPSPGETVAFRRGDETVSRVVLRIEGEDVVVRDGGVELRVASGDLVGELVHIVPRSGTSAEAD